MNEQIMLSLQNLKSVQILDIFWFAAFSSTQDFVQMQHFSYSSGLQSIVTFSYFLN